MPGNEAQREKWKTACLRHLSTFVEFGEPDPHLFRTLADNWCAYEIGGPLLNKNGRPKWFNNPDPVKERCALLAIHFVSKAARERIDSGESGLVKDHSIPLKILRERICTLEDHCTDAIEHELRQNYRVAIITKGENNLLNGNGLRKAMPSGWSWSSPFARYQAVGIKEQLNRDLCGSTARN